MKNKNKNDWKYNERLEYLGLTQLETRRTRSHLIETFKS